MIGEIHLTGEVVERLIRNELSRYERRVLIKHLNGSGGCKQCNGAADDPDGEERLRRLLDKFARLKFENLRRRVAAGDHGAEREQHDLRFSALMRQLREQK